MMRSGEKLTAPQMPLYASHAKLKLPYLPAISFDADNYDVQPETFLLFQKRGSRDTALEQTNPRHYRGVVGFEAGIMGY